MNKCGSFTHFCVNYGIIPSAFAECMTYEEQFHYLVLYLEKLGANVDEINKYLENLDIQEAVNKKLDEMAESGELEEIIASYLNTNAIIGFNTVNDMKETTSLINGSYARTLGKDSYTDGEGSFYKIRTVRTSDVIDEINIISLNNSDTLIAEKINDKTKLNNNLFLATFFSASDEKVKFSTSLDGINFSDILSEVNIQGRDPQITYNPKNNTFYICVTGGDSTSDFTLYKSTDLLTWTNHKVSLGLLSGYRWAPELFFDDNGDIYCFISCGTDTSSNMKIYKSKCTNIDTLTFENAVPVTLSATNMIDANVIKYNGLYYMCVKDNTLMREYIYSSNDLTTWTLINDNVLESGEHVEGGMLVVVDDKINFYGDTWESYNYYIMSQTKDLSSFQVFERPNSLIGKRHGSVLYLTDKRAINTLTSLSSYNNRVNINKNTRRQFDLSGNISYLAPLPNCVYRITANTVITNLNNDYNIDDFEFYFAGATNITLKITNVKNSEGNRIVWNKTISNSSTENEKLNFINLNGNPTVNHDKIVSDPTLKIATQAWGTSITFNLEVGHHAILVANGNCMYLIWRTGSGLNSQKISSTGNTFTFTYSGTTITATNQYDSAIEVFIG